MTTHEKALEAAAMAIRSDIWEREPNPTTERYLADLRQQAKDQAETAITAYISALLPEDAAGLVERLRSAHDRFAILDGVDNDGLCDVLEAASLIQSQAAGWAADKARIAELEEGLEPFASAADDAERLAGHDGPLGQYIDLPHLRRVHSLLNGERKG